MLYLVLINSHWPLTTLLMTHHVLVIVFNSYYLYFLFLKWHITNYLTYLLSVVYLFLLCNIVIHFTFQLTLFTIKWYRYTYILYIYFFFKANFPTKVLLSDISLYNWIKILSNLLAICIKTKIRRLISV